MISSSNIQNCGGIKVTRDFWRHIEIQDNWTIQESGQEFQTGIF